MDIQGICDHFCRYILKKNLLCISNTRKYSDDFSHVVINQQYIFNCSYLNRRICDDQYINDINKFFWNFPNGFLTELLNNSLRGIYGTDDYTITVYDYSTFLKMFILNYNKPFKLF